MKSLKENNHSKTDDHEEGSGKPLLDIGFFEKYIAIQNAHKETEAFHGDHIRYLSEADGNHMGKDTYGMTETGKYGCFDCTFVWPDPYFFSVLDDGKGCHDYSEGAVVYDSKKEGRRVLDCQFSQGRRDAIDQCNTDHEKRATFFSYSYKRSKETLLCFSNIQGISSEGNHQNADYTEVRDSFPQN